MEETKPKEEEASKVGASIQHNNNTAGSSEIRNRLDHQSQTTSTTPKPIINSNSVESSRNINSVENNSSSSQQQQNVPNISTAPSSINAQTRQQPPSLPPRRPVVNNNNAIPPVSEHFYQFQLRCLIFLVCAIVIGYMYVQIESNQSLIKYKLVPSSYSELSQNRHAVKKTIPPSVVVGEDEEDESEQDYRSSSMIDPEYKLQAEYLSKVLKSLGDLSRKFESTSNGSISKSIGGIVEMKAEYTEEEKEDENVPEYMKRLGNIIDNIKESKVGPKSGKKFQKFRPPPNKPKQETPDGVIKKTKNKIDEEEQEWSEFVNNLVETAYKLSREGNEEENDVSLEFDPRKSQDNNLVNNKNKYNKNVLSRGKDGVSFDDDDDILGLDDDDDDEINDDGLFNEDLDQLEGEIYNELNLQEKDKLASSSSSKQEKIKERLQFLEKLLEASKGDLIEEEKESLGIQVEKTPNSKSSSDKIYREYTSSSSKKSTEEKDDNNNNNNALEDDRLYVLD